MHSGPHFEKPAHSYGEPFGRNPGDNAAIDESTDNTGWEPQLGSVMSCPCGLEDYDNCTDCPYENCPVHSYGEPFCGPPPAPEEGEELAQAKQDRLDTLAEEARRELEDWAGKDFTHSYREQDSEEADQLP